MLATCTGSPCRVGNPAWMMPWSIPKSCSFRLTRVGKITLEITVPMGKDGYILPAAKLVTKPIPKPARPESIIYSAEDGDINGLPVPKQMTIREVKLDKDTKDPAAPAAKGM